MTYGIRFKKLARAMRSKNDPSTKIKNTNKRIKKAVEKALKPHTTQPKGAMKPKILSNFVKPTRMTKMTFEGSWNALCSGSLNQVSVPYVFRLNSIWDPDFSNFTRNTRANGWTLANTLYADYRVHKAKVTVTFTNNSEHSCYILLSANNDLALQSAASLPSDLLTRPGAYGKICTKSGSCKDMVSISKTYNLYDVEGISQDEYRDSSSTASPMSNNPSDNCYCYATIASMPEAFLNNTFGVFNIKIVFDVELLNPREAASTVV